MKLKRGSTTVELLVFIPIFAVVFSLVLFFENRRSEAESKFISDYIAEIRENSIEENRARREQNAIDEASLRGISCSQSPVYDRNDPNSQIENLGSVRVACNSLAGVLQGEAQVRTERRVRTATPGGTEDCQNDTINC